MIPQNPLSVGEAAEIIKQACKDRKNLYTVNLWLESDCSFADHEFYSDIVAIHCGMVGEQDYELVREHICDHVPYESVMPETLYCLLMLETGEWEDVFWHKYYRIAGLIESVEADGMQSEGDTMSIARKVAAT